MAVLISTAVCIIELILINLSGGKGEKSLPQKTLIHLFLSGFLVAVVILLLSLAVDDEIESFLTNAFGISSTGVVYALIDNFILIALVEEGLKYFALRTYLKKHDCIKCSHHLIIATVAVASGFTASENIMYLLFGGASLFQRLFAVFGHLVYAVFMGYILSKSMETDDPAQKKTYYRKAFLIPFLMHGVYDFSIYILQLDIDAFLYLFIFLVLIIIFIKFYIIASIKKIKETAHAELWNSTEVLPNEVS